MNCANPNTGRRTYNKMMSTLYSPLRAFLVSYSSADFPEKPVVQAVCLKDIHGPRQFRQEPVNKFFRRVKLSPYRKLGELEGTSSLSMPMLGCFKPLRLRLMPQQPTLLTDHCSGSGREAQGQQQAGE